MTLHNELFHWRPLTSGNPISKLLNRFEIDSTMVPLRGLSNFRATWQIPHTTWNICVEWSHWHYNDVILCSMASQITSLTNVYSNFYSGADQRKHQSSASLAFVWGKHRWPVISPHKWPVTRKLFLIDGVIMTNLYSTSRFGMYMNISISSDQKKIWSGHWNFWKKKDNSTEHHSGVRWSIGVVSFCNLSKHLTEETLLQILWLYKHRPPQHCHCP